MNSLSSAFSYSFMTCSWRS